jgi:hypothetical protein
METAIFITSIKNIWQQVNLKRVICKVASIYMEMEAIFKVYLLRDVQVKKAFILK